MRRKQITIALAITMTTTIVLAGCGSTATDTTAANITETVETAEESASSDLSTSADLSDVGTGDIYSATDDEEHAIEVDGETATYDNISVTKSGDSDGDEADFYGTNAAVFATNGANLTVTNSKIVTDGSHANAVFSYGEGTTLNISNSVIETSQNNSGGIMVTGGGTLNASNLVVTTQSGSSAAIRSDRGGGTIIADGGSYLAYGSGSPAIYSTADITVNDASLYSDISQAVVVEGANTVTLNNVDAIGNNTVKNSDHSDRYQAVMLYQSMSGDASEGASSFTMNGGSLTSLNEGMFFVTNTVADITLDSVDFTYASDDFLRIEAAGWGSDGSNGGQVNFNATNQDIEGVITVDDISTLNMYAGENTTFTGAIDSDGQVYVELTDGAKWVLTDDSSITSLTCDIDSIDLNGYTLTINGDTYEAGTESTGDAIEITVSSGNNHMGDGAPNGDAPSSGGPGGDAPSGGAPGGDAPSDMGDAPSGDRPELPDSESN